MFIKNILMFLIIGLFVGCNAQKNLKVPSLESTIFPEYPSTIEPINEPLFISYPFGSYQLGMTVKSEIYEKRKMNSSNLSMTIVNSTKRENKDSKTIDIISNNAIGMGNNTVAFLNCSYSLNIESQDFNNFSCKSSDSQSTNLMEEMAKKTILTMELNLLNNDKNGIKTGTVFNFNKIDLPMLKDYYVEEIVLGLGTFAGQKVIVTKIDIDKNIKNLGRIVAKGYSLYALKNSYPVFVKIVNFSSNDNFSVKTIMESSSILLPTGNVKITKPENNTIKGMESPREMYGVKYWE